MKLACGWNLGLKYAKPDRHQKSAFEVEQKQFKIGDEVSHWANHPVVMRWDWARRMRKKFNTDPDFRLLHNLRGRIRNAIYKNKGSPRRRARKSSRTMQLIGCTIAHFKQHIEAQFGLGMSWDNYGDWHIDHRIPCAHYDLSKPAQQRQCFHYSNLQPLWGAENIIKGDKVLRQQELLSA